MASLSSSWLYRDRLAADNSITGSLLVAKIRLRRLQASFLGQFPPNKVQLPLVISRHLISKSTISTLIQCRKEYGDFDPSIEPPPYHVYKDPTTGQLEPASGARASIPGKEYWPEGTISQVRAAQAPEPSAKSDGNSSYGKDPGSRRKKFKTNAASIDSPDSGSFSATNAEQSGSIVFESSDGISDENKDPSEEFVIYQTEEKENLTSYELDKKLGHPHPFVDPALNKPFEGLRSSEELWWNWRKPEKERWSRWQRRRPDVDTVFAKAMAETGQIKLYGDHPTLTETALARARKEVFKEERLEAEKRKLEEIGPIAYYSEWVKAWKQDTSREAVQRHYEETGEDENIQLIQMFQLQTAEEYRIMMGTDIRIKRDPLAMRMREDQIKEIWGGDPVYPTINYIQDPDEVTDYRGANFHEPTPEMLSYLMERGHVISRQELATLLAKERTEEPEKQLTDMDEAMAKAVDIGETDDGEDSEAEGVDDAGPKTKEKVTRNWSVFKSTQQLENAKEEPKRSMSLEEAIDDAENLTDFLMDFEEEE